MVRRGVVVLALVDIVLAVVTWARGPGTVYTVAQVDGGLAQHPRAWVGRTVTVRGTLAVAEGQNWVNGVVNGTWWSGCPVAGCSMGLPTDAPFHIILVAHGP
jgi:hypothetical protein